MTLNAIIKISLGCKQKSSQRQKPELQKAADIYPWQQNKKLMNGKKN